VYKLTFAHEPERNGENVSHPKSLDACLRTLAELLAVAAGRKTPTTITVEIRPPTVGRANMVSTDIETMRQAVHQNPTDGLARHALADACLEQGMAAEAARQRLIADALDHVSTFPAPASEAVRRLKRAHGYRGRKVRVRLSLSIRTVGACWDEGSLSGYYARNLRTGYQVPLPPQDPEVGLGNGVAVIERSVTPGKDLGIVIHCHPDDYPLLCEQAIDPTTCWQEMADALRWQRLSVAHERAVALRDWLKKGGALPQVGLTRSELLRQTKQVIDREDGARAAAVAAGGANPKSQHGRLGGVRTTRIWPTAGHLQAGDDRRILPPRRASTSGISSPSPLPTRTPLLQHTQTWHQTPYKRGRL
jgi:hypothetical protein